MAIGNSMTQIRIHILLTIPGLLLTLSAQEIPSSVRTFTAAHCLDCHAGDTPAGGINLETLSTDPTDPEVMRRWILVHDRVASGEMPPKDAEQPSTAASAAFLKTLSQSLTKAGQTQRNVVLRRLNRNEYQNTVRDLFQTNVSIHGLPEDSSTDGFDTVGEGLAVSAEAMQAYLEAADQVLDAVFGPPTKPTYIRHETNLLKQVDWKGRPQLESQIGKMFRRTAEGLVIFQSNYCPTNLVNFSRLRAPAGTYRGTIRVRAIQSSEPVTLRIYGGDTIVNRRERHLVGYYDVPPEWTTIEFEDKLVESGGTFLPKCYGTRDTRKDADTWPEPGLEIGDIVIEGPLEPWPPQSRGFLLGDINVKQATTTDARTIINRLLPRAFRRPVTPDEADGYVALFEAAHQGGRSFESALRVSLKAILCSPEFLFLHEPGQPVTQHALAARLSCFLWSSMPDDELQLLADTGQLAQPKMLRRQVERMLQSPKSEAFIRSFTGQWLDLREINFTEPDPNLYPEFDELLRISMVRETELFFKDVLANDHSITNFVDSEFTYLNARLADHYQIKGVEGQTFRRITLPPNSPRGGLLTQASILKVTANGTYTSPVIRGTWLLENILGTPTSPPPDNAGSVEPDIRGATTIRAQLAKHRNVTSCAACHSRIDPPGFALESFDPIGGLRTRYRTMSTAAQRPGIKQAPFTFAWVRYRVGEPVDAAFQLPDGTQTDQIQALKKHLASQPELLTRNLARKLLTYSLGRRIGFADRQAVEEILRATAKQDYGFRSLVHAIIQHPTFQQP